MNFPYMKVAIYALTFLTYAYSGYGSNTIVHLRDAIIAAEALFGDVFKNLITLLKKFHIVHELFDVAVDDDCVFKCPGDKEVRPVQNRLYTPTSDGCGSLGLRINTEFLPAVQMENCCNSHDICYDTCNSNKLVCDLEFKRCLDKHCDTYDQKLAGDLFIRGCKGAVKMLFSGTLTLGCKSYLDSQQRSCYCPTPKQYHKDDKSYKGRKSKSGGSWTGSNDL